MVAANIQVSVMLINGYATLENIGRQTAIYCFLRVYDSMFSALRDHSEYYMNIIYY